MNALIGLGLGIIIFALIVGVGTVVLQNFGGSTGNCGTSTCGTAGAYNFTDGTCWNATLTCGAPTGVGYTTTNTIQGYITSNLITWIPAVIALGVGLLFIGALMGKKGGNY